MNPILVELPLPIRTPRLLIRPVGPGDGPAEYEAFLESVTDLQPWMPFARNPTPTLEEAEANCRLSYARFLLREDIRLLFTDRWTGRWIGSTGFHRFSFDHGIFEIGYWVRSSLTGRGYVTEAVNALTRYAFSELGARRVFMACNVENTRSCRVPERLGFEREAVLKNHDRFSGPDVFRRDVVLYARTSAEGLPPLEADWGESVGE